MNQLSYCRLCAELKSIDDLSSIKNEYDQLSVEQKIFECFRLKIYKEDRLPKCVCQLCCEKLNSYFDFTKQVQKAQQTLHSSLITAEQNHVTIKNEIDKITVPSIGDHNEVTISRLTKTEDTFNKNVTNGLQTIKRQSNINLLQQKSVCGSTRSSSTHLSKDERNSSDCSKSDRKEIRRQLWEAWKNMKWKCSDCNQLLMSVKDLRTHYDEKHNKPVQYVCMECSRIYNNYLTFRNHLQGHRDKYKFRCDVCKNHFSSMKVLKNHRERHNEKRQKYICSTCGKGFLNERYLIVHQRKHSLETIGGAEKRKFECDVCNRSYMSTHSLNNHKKVHTGVKDHTCEQCGKSFVYKKYLDDHVTSHRDDRPFNCEKCPASFKSKRLLRSHHILHVGIKQFQCDICGKKFLKKIALIEHSIIHTDLYPFKCEICNKGFRSKSNVVRHQVLHTGERPYSCEPCGRHFTCQSNYDKHMRRHHGVVKIKRKSLNNEPNIN